jgi:hypothetical protein
VCVVVCAGNHTSSAVSPFAGSASHGLWLGTTSSLLWYNYSTTQPFPTDPTSPATPYSAWRYLSGGRWLGSSSAVVSVCVLLASNTQPNSAGAGAGDVVVVVTEKGLAVLQWVQWTLQQKAEYLEGVMGRHDLFGMGLAGGCRLQAYGNVSSWQMQSDDNNGLWYV